MAKLIGLFFLEKMRFLMLLLPIDYAGCIENPHFSSADELDYKSGWGALCHRRGAKIINAAFLPKDQKGIRLKVSELHQGLYIAFGATHSSRKVRSLYVVESVTAVEILFRAVGECSVPAIYEVDISDCYDFYLLKAKQAMLEVQINDIRKWLFEHK